MIQQQYKQYQGARALHVPIRANLVPSQNDGLHSDHGARMPARVKDRESRHMIRETGKPSVVDTGKTWVAWRCPCLGGSASAAVSTWHLVRENVCRNCNQELEKALAEIHHATNQT